MKRNKIMKEENKEQLKEIESDIKKYAKIAEMANTEGGQELIARLGSDIVSSIEILKQKYKTASHIELIFVIAKLDVFTDMYRDLIRAEGNKTEEKKRYKETLEKIMS